MKIKPLCVLGALCEKLLPFDLKSRESREGRKARKEEKTPLRAWRAA
jgi:hypothetical protein